MKWAYGVTTVPRRFTTLLPRTLASLALAGFEKPRLFVDEYKGLAPDPFKQYEVVTRWPKIGVVGNWWLGLLELFIREPDVDRYAMFQDDLITYPNLKSYLERTGYPKGGYCNLYTFPHNYKRCPKDKTGWYLSDQMGKGAVALVFDQEAAKKLLIHEHMVGKVQSVKRHTSLDGAIVTALTGSGIREYVHGPSLVQHTGYPSTMGSRKHLRANSFRGEKFDPLSLLD